MVYIDIDTPILIRAYKCKCRWYYFSRGYTYFFFGGGGGGGGGGGEEVEGQGRDKLGLVIKSNA